MKIYLYLKNKILTFTVPQRISGTFNFDEDPEEESKLINIEAKDDNWYLYSTSDVHVIHNGVPISDILLQKDKFYVLKRDNIEYLILVTSSFDDSFLPYKYSKNLNLIIGNDKSCNINYPCPYIKGVAAKISIKDDNFTVEVSNNNVYLNNVILPSDPTIHTIPRGSQINIYGLKIAFLNEFLLLNDPLGLIRLNLSTTGLLSYSLTSGNDNPLDIEFKDIDLYKKEEYYSKSPRVRRTIKTKVIDLSAPPKLGGDGKMPLILTIGPMVLMGLTSGIMFVYNVTRVTSGEISIKQIWPSLLSSGVMIVSMILWPLLSRSFDKKIRKKRKKEIADKYTKYLEAKEKELQQEQNLQKEILLENIISVDECLEIIKNAKINFWNKRIEQNDFLVVRLGIGNELLDVKINFPKEGFTVDEDELRKQADNLVEKYRFIPDVPIGYSFYTGRETAIMGEVEKCYGLIHNIILQLITFYSYEDIKIVIMTNRLNEDKWEYIKYLNHNFSNNKEIRFFSANLDSAKVICEYLNGELQKKLNSNQNNIQYRKPYYIIITDDYPQIRRLSFMKTITESDINLGFSLLMLENNMSKLPSKCNNFINMSGNSCGLLKNSFEAQEMINFKDEINYGINMASIARKLSNIPIEFEEGNNQLPDTVTFLEMEKVGKVEQLNILNRWDSNDSTASLRAEVGVDEDANVMYLDLHERYHGPHGLIAGMTGSGKSEFIITYILSMAINYSPDDVAFILIDYKGGGLAFAFENKATGLILPHLAGVITNLDEAEMDRTLVSIDSEIKRRQRVFNAARDVLGESTMDIYKYQRYFKDGKLREPIPHLFIICDEFAELKTQQPDFMDNLISVARIGRSLGIHLILSTQKPSGIVNNQIWSNTSFRICFKVQNTEDSKEMLKRPEAASIKQIGRFYMQVGFDEYFALGQSAWCGAKYFPSDKIIKQVDRSVNFIDETGKIIKSIEARNNIRIEAKGEQLVAILKNIVEVANKTQKRAKKLWLDDIAPIIIISDLEKKYGFKKIPYNIEAIIGEYDAPERQEQGLLTYSVNKQGNTIIYGNDEIEKENLLNSIIYSICKNHNANEINIYIIDYGSESLRMFYGFPQIGGMVHIGEDEGLKNLFKLITEEIRNRKKMLVSFGGSIDLYNQRNEEKLTRILFIINGYDALLESYNSIYDDIASIGRDCERYGITLILTCNTPMSITRKVAICFDNKYSLHLNDPTDYFTIFNKRARVKPKSILGRGLVDNSDEIHEFQTSKIVPQNVNLNDYIENMGNKLREISDYRAKIIPTLPRNVTLEIVENEILSIEKTPIGISKETLKIVDYDFTINTATQIISNRLNNINSFMNSLLEVFLRIKDLTVFFIDTLALLPNAEDKVFNNKKINYFNSNFDAWLEKFIEVERNPEYNKFKSVFIFYGIEKLKTKVDVRLLESLFNEIRQNEYSYLIICDSAKSLKLVEMDLWYSRIKSNTDGIWVGKGFAEQQNFRINRITKEMSNNYKNNYGFCLKENVIELIKLLEFEPLEEGEENEE